MAALPLKEILPVLLGTATSAGWFPYQVHITYQVWKQRDSGQLDGCKFDLARLRNISGILCCCVPPALQQAERCNAARLVLVAPEEWGKGLVRVKDLGSREERDVPLDQL